MSTPVCGAYGGSSQTSAASVSAQHTNRWFGFGWQSLRCGKSLAIDRYIFRYAAVAGYKEAIPVTSSEWGMLTFIDKMHQESSMTATPVHCPAHRASCRES